MTLFLCVCCNTPDLELTGKGAVKAHRTLTGGKCDGGGLPPRPEEDRGKPAPARAPDAAAEVAPVPSKAGEAAAEWVDIKTLVPWGENPRKNDPAVPSVAASIQRFGWGAPILARRADQMIIAGHTRYKAARQLGLDRVPVRFVDLDPVDARLLALADNKTAEIAEWDDEVLARVLTELKEQDVDLIVGTGFSEEEVLRAMGEEVDVPGDDDLDGLLDPAHDHSKPAPEAPVLVWRKWRLAMSADDARMFEEKLTGFIEQHGTTFGLVSQMLDGFAG